MSDDVVIATTALMRPFGALVAVDHLDLVVGRGTIVGPPGPNGAGKTTTVTMLTTRPHGPGEPPAVRGALKTRERFMGIGQVLTMPLFFASNAICPLSIMPPWLRVVARVNPLSYLVDALRGLMVRGGQHAFGVGTDPAVQGLAFTALLAIAARLYPGLVR